MQKSSTIDFWLGFKYGSWQYYQKCSHLKDISPVMLKIFVFLFLSYILFCCTNQKIMLQKEIKDWAFKFYLTGEPNQPLNPAIWHFSIGVVVPLPFDYATNLYLSSYRKATGITFINTNAEVAINFLFQIICDKKFCKKYKCSHGSWPAWRLVYFSMKQAN